MCKVCKSRNETYHLFYWMCEWQKRFWRTLYHFVNRRAYHRWQKKRGCNWQKQKYITPTEQFSRDVEVYNRHLR